MRSLRFAALSALTGVLLACGTATAAATAAAGDPPEPTVSVVGQGSATSPPDMAVVSVGVEATRPTASDASAAMATAAKALLDAVHAQGVADQDVITQGLGLNPVYTYESNVSKVTGYSASESFAVTVRDARTVGAVVQAAATATGDAGRITGVSFGLADHTPLLAQARDRAMTDAQAKASQYAELSGHRLGDVVSLSEGAQSVPTRPGPVPPPLATGVAGPPIATGEIKDEVSVAAVYGLGPVAASTPE